ncbi:MAG: AmmeMemoRadiSam system protein B [Rubrivivax sp.]|nr:AmmeMemoRadiSam system protein B [Rubrivivax sp.]MBK7261831.1 AmmeMemoRadiSam system protein B [Rubrivivax sp.]MBK8526578.1 AmmeMemoRadiSam system protein B [Rubrivivax sp.]
MPQIRRAAVAGRFYPDTARALQAAVVAHLGHAATPDHALHGTPKLLVVPHAGYVYSGDVAASAYALLTPLRGRVRRVVLLAPTHLVAVRGLVVPTVDAFETPLGRVTVDHDALALIASLPQVGVSDQAHALEHAIEVQLPFLQIVLGNAFSLVPLAVGDAQPHEVDAVIERLWGDDETLIVISTDLSHYRPYEQACELDRQTVLRILNFADDLRGDEACGARSLNGALRAARRHGLRPQLLDMRNSADTAGTDPDRVVGYGAIVFEAAPEGPDPTPDGDTDDAAGSFAADRDLEFGPALLATARAEIAKTLLLPALTPEPTPATTPAAHPALALPGASFVTLHDAQGRLRGCVGHLAAHCPLGDDVRANAHAAAFTDPRFSALSAAEWPGLRIEVSVLGPLERLSAAATLDQAAAALRPGVDGVALRWRRRHGTFLPQVWSVLQQPQEFLQALLRKARLPPEFWAGDIELWRFPVSSFQDPPHGDRH